MSAFFVQRFHALGPAIRPNHPYPTAKLAAAIVTDPGRRGVAGGTHPAYTAGGFGPERGAQEASLLGTRARRRQCGALVATLLALASGCGFVPIPVGADAPAPAPPIDFARALELARIATDVTQNARLTADDLRTLYTTADTDVYVFNTVLPGDDGETRFMLLTDHTRRRQTLALGGTNTYRQWQFDALTVPAYQEDLDAAVHAGWNLLAFAVINSMLPELRTDYTLTITGFSLGGALSAITSKYLKLAGYQVTEVVTFGQPRVTDVAGVAAFADVPITRFVNDGDPFPHMRPSDGGAAHFGRMVLLYTGPFYAYVPAGDPRLEAGARPFDAFLEPEFEYHSENLYIERLTNMVAGATEVIFPP